MWRRRRRVLSDADMRDVGGYWAVPSGHMHIGHFGMGRRRRADAQLRNKHIHAAHVQLSRYNQMYAWT